MVKKVVFVLFAGLVGTTASSSLQRRIRAARHNRVTLENAERVRRSAQVLLDRPDVPVQDVFALRNLISAIDAAEINHTYGHARKVKRCLAFASQTWSALAKRYPHGRPAPPRS